MAFPNLRGDMDFVFNGEFPPRVPEADYDMVFVGGNRKRIFGNGERMFLWFRIITPGDWFGTELYMTCAVPLGGHWGPSHKFMQVWMLVTGQVPKRRDRINTAVLKNKVFRARVRIVTRDARQHPRPPEQQYSVIDEILEVVAGRTDANQSPNHRPSTEDI